MNNKGMLPHFTNFDMYFPLLTALIKKLIDFLLAWLRFLYDRHDLMICILFKDAEAIDAIKTLKYVRPKRFLCWISVESGKKVYLRDADLRLWKLIQAADKYYHNGLTLNADILYGTMALCLSDIHQQYTLCDAILN